MLNFLWVIMEVLLYALAGCVVLIIPACILDSFRGNKNGNVEKKRASGSWACGAYDAAHSHMNHSHQFDRDIQATASRMAQEAHDTAVRETRIGCTMMPAVWLTRVMTQPPLTIKQLLIFTTMLFQILASDVVARFFDMTPIDFAVTIRNEYLLLKYTDILKRINEFTILYDWDFDQSAEYLMLTRRERRDCINIIDIKQGSPSERIRKYLNIKD